MAQKTTTSSSPAAGLRKRQQIESSNRVMFLWVAGASIIVAFAIVGSIFLAKQLIFNQKVLIEDTKTAGVLNENITTAKSLDKSINALRADPAISQVPAATNSSNNLDKILDALPYEGDWVGLGSSLQSTLLSGISLESLSVDSTSSSAVTTSSGVNLSAIQSVGSTLPITFTFKISGSDNELKALLARLDSSIRPIKIVNLKLESAGPNKINATVQAVTYYQPEKTFELGEKTIKP